jgi:UPF0716 protein FxsA
MGPLARSLKPEVMPFFFLTLYPLAEIAAFVIVGRAIGLLPTLALVVASTAVGLALVRDTGAITLARLRQAESPDSVLAEGGSRMLAGLLLMVPGFLSDLAALALLIPGLRPRAATIVRLSRAPGRSNRPTGPAPAPTIEGDYRRLDS